jgi:hypothetical protein
MPGVWPNRVGYPVGVSRPRHHRSQKPLLRRAARLLALVPALALTFTASSAFADAPDSWPNDPSVPALRALLVYLVIPAGLFALIALLVYIPSMSRNQTYQPGQPWRHEPLWFGGPRGGVEALEDGSTPAEAGQPAHGDQAATQGSAAGGTSARW